MNMKTYSVAELAEIIEKHHKYLLCEEGGERANLRYADLRYADLRYADLRSANLRYANLRSADLSYADLRSADLRSANLSYADLSSADLRSANLRSANLRSANLRSASLRYADLRYARSLNGCTGNMTEVKSIQCDYWPVTYTATHMQIGCQLHLIQEWWDFKIDEIERMDSNAAVWWAIWKPILRNIMEASPAKATEAKAE